MRTSYAPFSLARSRTCECMEGREGPGGRGGGGVHASAVASSSLSFQRWVDWQALDRGMQLAKNSFRAPELPMNRLESLTPSARSLGRRENRPQVKQPRLRVGRPAGIAAHVFVPRAGHQRRHVCILRCMGLSRATRGWVRLAPPQNVFFSMGSPACLPSWMLARTQGASLRDCLSALLPAFYFAFILLGLFLLRRRVCERLRGAGRATAYR